MLDPLARKSSLFELSFVQNLTDSTLNCRFVLGIGFSSFKSLHHQSNTGFTCFYSLQLCATLYAS